MAYEYEHEHRNMKAGVYSGLATNESVEEIKEVYRKAKAFDNYMVDLVKSMETYPHEYLTEDNFVQKTYEFYMQDKEDFIKFYKDDRRSGHEVIADVEEYDEIINELERVDDER